MWNIAGLPLFSGAYDRRGVTGSNQDQDLAPTVSRSTVPERVWNVRITQPFHQ